MNSCVVEIQDVVGLLLTEAHYYLELFTKGLGYVQFIDGIGVVMHIIVYTASLLFLSMLVYIWRGTRQTDT